MPFFEPLPDPPLESIQPTPAAWAPPQWDRPSEGTLPAIVGVSRLFGRTDNTALALDHLRVYPNGFQLVISMITSPRLAPELRMGGFSSATMLRAVSRAGKGDDANAALRARQQQMLAVRARHMGPRVGVRFSDGQRAATGSPFAFDVAKDAAGFPSQPLITGHGGGGSNGQMRYEFWVYPLPPPGPVEVFAEWTTAGIDETSMVISGDDIRAAAPHAVVLWS